MEDNRFTAEFCGKTVVDFCRFTEEMLRGLAADLALTLSPAGLLHTQKYFRNEAKRDPTVGELRLLAALAACTHRLPAAITLGDVCFEDAADARIFADITRQRNALAGKKGATAPDVGALLHTVTAYLARAGREAKRTRELSLFCGESAVVAARTGDATLTLSVGEASCAAVPALHGRTHAAGDMLLLLRAEADTPLSLTVARFFLQFANRSPAPLAYIGAEGLAAHLGALPMGAELDMIQATDFDATRGAPALADACQNSLLLTVPPSEAALLLQAGAPVTLIGRLSATAQITVRYGMQSLLSLSRTLLASFGGTRRMRVTVPRRAKESTPPPVASTVREGMLLCGVALDGAPEGALSALLSAAFAAGATMENARLATVLSLPLAADEAAVAAALSLALPLHRFAAELALPTAALRVVTAPAHTAPSLTVFLSAEVAAAPEADATAALAAALKAGDFATVRRLIYPEAAKA